MSVTAGFDPPEEQRDPFRADHKVFYEMHIITARPPARAGNRTRGSRE